MSSVVPTLEHGVEVLDHRVPLAFAAHIRTQPSGQTPGGVVLSGTKAHTFVNFTLMPDALKAQVRQWLESASAFARLFNM